MKHPSPQICTSSHGCKPPNEHCRECSHAIFKTTLDVSGRKYIVEYAPQFGVHFSKADRKKVDPGWWPNRNHPVLKAFGKWFNDTFAKEG